MNIYTVTMPLFFVYCCGCLHSNKTNLPAQQENHGIAKLQMHLSAVGVESDFFPHIDANIDFAKKLAICRRWYNNPIYKDSIYALSTQAIDTLQLLLLKTDCTTWKRFYECPKTDQPTSTIQVMLMKGDTVTIKDYGLIGDYPLQDMYRIVYQLRSL